MDIEIFRAGKRLDANGKEFDISVSDLEQVVASYNPAFHEAPAVIGHPKMNNPAYAWVEKLHLDGDVLKATFKQIAPEFSELVKKGRFKKVSASFYTPDSPNNPHQGRWSIRHVGFLGAVPPAVKGLKEPVFNETDLQGVVDFNEYDDGQTMSNTATAQENPATNVQSQTIHTNSTHQTPPTPNPPSTGESEMSQADKDELERLRQQVTKFEQEKAQAELETKKKDNAIFAEKLLGEGKLAPVAKEKAIALLDSALSQDLAHKDHADFSEATALLPLVQDFLNAQPKVVEFGEVATSENAGTADDDSVSYAETDDPKRVELDKQARAYMKKHNVDYATAIKAVMANR